MKRNFNLVGANVSGFRLTSPWLIKEFGCRKVLPSLFLVAICISNHRGLSQQHKGLHPSHRRFEGIEDVVGGDLIRLFPVFITVLPEPIRPL
jgi:hypothetical protein